MENNEKSPSSQSFSFSNRDKNENKTATMMTNNNISRKCIIQDYLASQIWEQTWTSPIPSASIFPISRETRRPRWWSLVLSASPICLTISPLFGAGIWNETRHHISAENDQVCRETESNLHPYLCSIGTCVHAFLIVLNGCFSNFSNRLNQETIHTNCKPHQSSTT